jgi:hypothetical protein
MVKSHQTPHANLTPTTRIQYQFSTSDQKYGAVAQGIVSSSYVSYVLYSDEFGDVFFPLWRN